MFSISDERSGKDGEEGEQARITRRDVAMQEREKWLRMPIEEKREHYKRPKFVELQDVPTWTQYFHEHGQRLLKQAAKDKKRKAGQKNKRPPPPRTYAPNAEYNGKVSLWRGDITTLEIDAIVNAANNTLQGGGGVDGAIHTAAGSALKAECATLNGCTTGDAKTTGGYKLPAKYVIHTVGPVGFFPEKLHTTYKSCLNQATTHKIRSVAFPCISTGIYGYPNENACQTALEEVRMFLENGGDQLVERVIFCLFLPKDVNFYEEYMQIYFPLPEDDIKKAGRETDIDEEYDALEENGNSGNFAPKGEKLKSEEIGEGARKKHQSDEECKKHGIENNPENTGKTTREEDDMENVNLQQRKGEESSKDVENISLNKKTTSKKGKKDETQEDFENQSLRKPAPVDGREGKGKDDSTASGSDNVTTQTQSVVTEDDKVKMDQTGDQRNETDEETSQKEEMETSQGESEVIDQEMSSQDESTTPGLLEDTKTPGVSTEALTQTTPVTKEAIMKDSETKDLTDKKKQISSL